MDEHSTETPPIWGASRSLKKICKGKEDIVGLIAYGIFKLEQSEWASDAKPLREEVDKHHQTLQSSRIESLRSNAESRLTDWVASVEEDWRATMYDEIRDSVAAKVAEEVEARVTQRLSRDVEAIRNSTSFKTAIFANIAGWLVSIGLTALIVISTVLPSITTAFSDLVRQNISNTSSSADQQRSAD